MRLKRAITFLLAAALTLSTAACTKPSLPADKREMTDVEFALSSIAGTDEFGRVTAAGDLKYATKRDVGLFYFLWLGAHGNQVYDVSELEKTSPDDILDPNSKISPVNKYHFWGKPLYGYYRSEDPWVINRHVELFIAADIDFLVFDVTNGPTYDNVVKTMLETLEKYRLQGFKVPKVVFMTNSNSQVAVKHFYEWYYVESSDHYYPELWYCPSGKPLIIGDIRFFDPGNSASGHEKDEEMLEFFDLRKAQWPDEIVMDDEAFPWISWEYPQYNHNGIMSVSVAQHTSRKMSQGPAGNWGRAFSFEKQKPFPERLAEGLNIQGQWNTVFKSNESKYDFEHVDTVFVTGWNEWIAIKKYEGGTPFFVDQYNAEYSRDIEMDAEFYKDSYYMQLVQNIRRFKYSAAVEYAHENVTISGGADDEKWESVRSYLDLKGDAMARNYSGYENAGANKTVYTDDTNRNDIVDIKVAADGKYAYFRVECADDITAYEEGDETFMNIWLNPTHGVGFPYVINHTFGKLSELNSDGSYSVVADASVTVSGKVMTATVPLKSIGVKSGSIGFIFKVSDHVDASDPMNFYIQGDSAPIGRLGYTYGYIK